MKSSPLLPLFLFLASTQAATLPRSQHDGMLERNFKNVLQRDPQGPASNPGEFPNPDAASSSGTGTGTDTGSGSGSGSSYVPQPVMDAPSSSSSGSAPQPVMDAPSSISSGPIPNPVIDPVDAFPGLSTGGGGGPGIAMSTGRRHHHPSGSGYLPEPTGGHHRHHNKTDHYLYGPGYASLDEIVEEIEEGGIVTSEIDIQPDGEVDLQETLWKFNGTKWNHTNIPLPSSASIIGTLMTVPLPTGSGRPPAPPSPSSGSSGFASDAAKPGFTGPKGSSAMEIASDGTGMEEMAMGLGMGMTTGTGDADVGMKRAVKEKKRWLGGWI